MKREVSQIKEFIKKFNNDWSFNLASALAYNLLNAVLPIFIALLSIVGIVLGRLDIASQSTIINDLQHVLPNSAISKNLIQSLISHLASESTLLGIIAVLVAIFGGSRLFITLESYFDIIYRSKPRGIVSQNIMAIGMIILFTVLVPLMIFASSLPFILISLVDHTKILSLNIHLSSVPFIFTFGSVVGGLLVGVIFFTAIYLILPNRKWNIKKSWKGILVSAFLLEIYLLLFPFYTSKFLNGYAGEVGFAIILLAFFYYFALILLIGAEINSFFGYRLKPLENDLPTLIHRITKDGEESGA